MDDIRRAKVRTLTRDLGLIQEKLGEVRDEEESDVENKSVPSDAWEDLDSAFLIIEEALDSLKLAVGDE